MLGPVFIWSGDKIGKKDYILNKGEAHVPNLIQPEFRRCGA